MELTFQLLEAGDENLEKRGLQKLCEQLEDVDSITLTYKERLLRALSRLQCSESILVRRWLYKAMGLVKSNVFLPYLKGQIFKETDEENQTWIVAAIYHVLDAKEAFKLVKLTSITSSAFKLATGFFEPTLLPKTSGELKKVLDENNHLALKWFGLLYGNSLENFQIDKNQLTDLLTRLNSHNDSGVAEYSVWALHKSEDGKFSDSEIVPQNLSAYAPNVRRWIYRLISKDKDTIFSYFDLIKVAIQTENSISAREGLATGLREFAGLEPVIPLISNWFQNEKNSLVRIQLLRIISENASAISLYRELLKEELTNPTDRISKFIAEDGLKKTGDLYFIQGKMSFNMPQKKVLIVVATDTELKILYDKFKEFGIPKIFQVRNMLFWRMATIGNLEVISVKSGMGYSGSSGALLTISEAIRDVEPDFVIMVGIAFGLKEDKQNLTEILVSRQLEGYELAKITDGMIIHRADKISASPYLVSKFENSKLLWSGPEVHFGLILSGEKLSNSKYFVEQLKTQYPEAIGGEMEGIGLQSTSYREKKDWIVVKGICDWGYDKEDGYQNLAMENAVNFLIHTLKEMPF